MVKTDDLTTEEDYSKHFTEEKFWDKILRFGKQAGVKLTYGALILFYTFKKPTVPKKTKATILGALGYFISPLDIVPDFIPVAGYADDLGIVVAALLLVATYIDTESKQLAKAKVVDWFGDNAVKHTDSLDDEIVQSKIDKADKKASKSETKQEKKDSKIKRKEEKKENKAKKDQDSH